MNILVLASLRPSATANYLIRALQDCGHELLVCSDVASPLAGLQIGGPIDVSKVCLQHNLAPDLVLFIEGGTMRLLPVGLENMECLTAWYGIDTHMDYPKHLRIGRLFDVTFVAQKEYVSRLQQDGLRQVHWLPLAFAAELIPKQILPRDLDIAYVGSVDASINPSRHSLLTALKREFPSHYFGLASPQEMISLYARARLVFNRSVGNDVNMRYFEAAGAGAVLVTDQVRNNGLETLFQEGVHYIVYPDESALLEIVRALLVDPMRCEAIGRAAKQRVLERHTYRHRANTLLIKMQQADKLRKPKPDDYFSAFLALDMLGGAMQFAGMALIVKSGSVYKRILWSAFALGLRASAAILNLLERLLYRP
jgi:hypothetical protein